MRPSVSEIAAREAEREEPLDDGVRVLCVGGDGLGSRLSLADDGDAESGDVRDDIDDASAGKLERAFGDVLIHGFHLFLFGGRALSQHDVQRPIRRLVRAHPSTNPPNEALPHGHFPAGDELVV